MLFTDLVYIGVDLISGHKALTYAALDRDLNLVALADAHSEKLMAFLGGQKSAVIAVNAPSHVNHGIIKKNLRTESLTPLSIRGLDMRLAEYELRQRGIAVESQPDADAAHQWLETNSYACFCVLLGIHPLPKLTLEGRLQRELLLYELGLHIHDPMVFFEEITRHKLLNGILPFELVHSPAQLDAMVAAYTAWQVIQKPDEAVRIGHHLEGFITLPVSALKEKY